MRNASAIRYTWLVPVFLAAPIFCLFAAPDLQKVMVGIGQSEIIELAEPVKRISITNPEIADATVASPRQILVNGKALGTTSMIVWDESEKYSIFKLIVHSEASYHQVMLRVRFAEVNRTALRELGLNFLLKNKHVGGERVHIGVFGGKVNRPVDPFTLPNNDPPEQQQEDFREAALNDNVDLFLSIPTRQIAGVIKALEEKNLLTTLATPNLSATNGTEASFLAGGEIPIPIVSGASGQVTIHYKEYGIRLKFIPTVLDTQLVNIKVATEASSLDFDNGIILSGFRIPALLSRKTETTVELNDGEYFVIGGLISSEAATTASRIPVLGHIPVLGKLFSSERFQNNESELIIVISPHIVQSMREDEVPELH